jgi:holo-ACP synthase
MYSGVAITLEQLLASREARAEKQRAWLDKHALPIISFTINMVGEVKLNALSKIAFTQGIEAIMFKCEVSDLPLHASQSDEYVTGLEFIASIEHTTGENLKRLMVSIEDNHPLGRLFDIDVIEPNGNVLSRDNLAMDRRRCLVCDNDAKICARTRQHSKQLIIDKMTQLVVAH